MSYERWVGVITVAVSGLVVAALVRGRDTFVRLSASPQAGARTWRVFIGLAVFAALAGVYLLISGSDEIPF